MGVEEGALALPRLLILIVAAHKKARIWVTYPVIDPQIPVKALSLEPVGGFEAGALGGSVHVCPRVADSLQARTRFPHRPKRPGSWRISCRPKASSDAQSVPFY